MNIVLLAAALAANPAPTSFDLDAMFDTQRQTVVLEMRDETRADLRLRSARYFAENGELQRLLGVQPAKASLAAR